MVGHQLGPGDLAAAHRLNKANELENARRRYREAMLVLVVTLYGQKTSLVLSSSCSSSSSATVCLVSSWVEPQRGQESSAPPIWIQSGEYHHNITTTRGHLSAAQTHQVPRLAAVQGRPGGRGAAHHAHLHQDFTHTTTVLWLGSVLKFFQITYPKETSFFHNNQP